MPRLDIIISEKAAAKLRHEALRKYGGKKGSLSMAVEEALEQWFRSGAIERLKDNIIKGVHTSEEFEASVDTLANQGKISVPALLDIKEQTTIPSEARYVAKTIERISRGVGLL